jgi:hypothetical protein
MQRTPEVPATSHFTNLACEVVVGSIHRSKE